MSSRRFETQFFIGFLLVAAALLVFVLYPHLDGIVLGVAFAILFHPVYKWFRKIIKTEWIAALLTVIVSIAVILGPLTYFGFKILQEAQGLYAHFVAGDQMPTLGFLHDQLARYVPWLDLDVNQYSRQVLEVLVGNLGAVFSRTASVAGTFFLAFFALYYFLKDGQKLRSAIIRTSPLSRADTDTILKKLASMANSVIKGSLVVAIVQGVFVGVGFLVFGLPSPVLWGSVSILAALVPILGTALVVIPGVLSLIFSGDIAFAIGFAAWGFFGVGLIDNFLRPRLIERNEKVHPLLVLLSVFGGMSLFGPMGFILGPLALSLFLALLDIYPALVLEREEEK